MQHGRNATEAAQKIMGMIDLCQGLEDLHDAWKHKHGLR